MRSAPDLSRDLVQAAKDAPYLTHDDERDLATRWRTSGDEAALHRLAAAHMRLVIAQAARFRRYGLPLADLVQEGHVGLLEAAARFEPDREVRFATYATWWIRAAIQDHVLRNWSIVRGGTSSAQKALFFNLRRLRARLVGAGETTLPASAYAQMATRLGVDAADVAAMDARLTAPDMSLNAPLSDADDNSLERQDMLVCDRPLPDEAAGERIDAVRRIAWLKAAMAALTPRERKVLRARRLTEAGATLETLGAKLGISKERVRQIESRALEKLRAALLARRSDAKSALI